MTTHPRFRALLWVPVGVALLAFVLLAVAGVGVRAGLWHFRTGFTLLRWSAWLGGGGALLALVALVAGRPRGGLAALLGLALAAGSVAIATPAYWRIRANSVPRIHDVTTDTRNPPVFVDILPLRADAPNSADYAGEAIATLQREAYPDITPRVVAGSPAEVFDRVLATVRALGWEVVAADPEAGRIEATDTTPFFGFKDDVVLRLAPEGDGVRVDMRSLSRVGGSDVGTNARRIRSFFDRLGS